MERLGLRDFKPNDSVYVNTFSLTGRNDFIVESKHRQIMDMIRHTTDDPIDESKHIYRCAYKCMRDALDRFDEIWEGQRRGDTKLIKDWHNLCDDVVIVAVMRYALHNIPIPIIPNELAEKYRPFTNVPESRSRTSFGDRLSDANQFRTN